MPEINLLQNQLKDTTLASRQRTQLAALVSGMVLVLLIVCGVILYLLTQAKQTKIAEITEDNNKTLERINENDKNLSEAKAYQAKLSNLDLLLKNHIMISPLLREFETYTYKQAKFVTLDVAEDTGKVHLEGQVSSYEALGKLLLGLTTSTNFRNVKLATVIPSSTDNSNNYIFSIDLNVNTNIFVPNREEEK
ncbi:MAG: hypothetical protein KW804_01925 [Candidatus Doudnabacteria bacterium]|nr:hypothetical protein [Candidatus Doudnabacteria bacterium]